MTAAVSELEHLDDAEVYRQLQAARQSMSRDLLRDPVTLARGLDRRFRMRPHLRIIAEALRDVAAGRDDRLLILTPPQVGKSTTVAEWFPYWWLCLFPMDKVAVTSYGDDLALRRGKRIRSYVETYGAEWDLFMQPGSGAKQDWEVTRGGGVRSVSVGQGLTGFDVNLLVIDDPHKDRADAESEASRKALHDWYSSAGLTRLQPDRNAVVAIQTRWHPDDFAGRRLEEEGRVEDGGRWRVIHLPALADPKFGPDPLGRAPGEPLPHPKIPLKDTARAKAWWVGKKATTIVRDWHAVYQGDPQPAAGALVSEELLRLIRDTKTVVEPQKIAVSIDPSGGGRDVAGVMGGFLGDDDRVWITHDRSGPMSSAEWSTVACMLAYETNAAIIYVEWNFGRDMCVLAINTSWKKLQDEGVIPKNILMPAVQPVRAKQGKLLRAEPIAQQMVQDRVRTRGVLVDWEREWTTWQPTDPDSPGRIDSSCVLIYGLIPEANQGAIVHPPLPQAPQPGHAPTVPPSQAAAVYGRRIGK